MDINRFISLHPMLYHMAEYGSWESIKKHGLMSTLALLDLFGISGTARTRIIENRRPQMVYIEHKDYGRAAIRDNKPMNEIILARSLKNGLTPRDWYIYLNQFVFFWVNKSRLNKLLNARAYRDKRHTVLTINTKSLLQSHVKSTLLSPINSGAALFKAPARCKEDFKPIESYPYDIYAKRASREGAVELLVSYSVPYIEKHVLSVDDWHNGVPIPKS